MKAVLRVSDTDLTAMASRWRALVVDLSGGVEPASRLGLSCQASAAASIAGHADVTAATAALAAHLRARAARVDQADTRYVINEADSAATLATVVDPVIGS